MVDLRNEQLLSDLLKRVNNLFQYQKRYSGSLPSYWQGSFSLVRGAQMLVSSWGQILAVSPFCICPGVLSFPITCRVKSTSFAMQCWIIATKLIVKHRHFCLHLNICQELRLSQRGTSIFQNQVCSIFPSFLLESCYCFPLSTDNGFGSLWEPEGRKSSPRRVWNPIGRIREQGISPETWEKEWKFPFCIMNQSLQGNIKEELGLE